MDVLGQLWNEYIYENVVILEKDSTVLLMSALCTLCPQGALRCAQAHASSPPPQPVQRRSYPGRVGREIWQSTCPRKPPRLCPWTCRRAGTRASRPWRAWRPRPVPRPQLCPACLLAHWPLKSPSPLSTCLTIHALASPFHQAWPKLAALAVRAALTSPSSRSCSPSWDTRTAPILAHAQPTPTGASSSTKVAGCSPRAQGGTGGWTPLWEVFPGQWTEEPT